MSRKGFSLIELLIVIVVIGILSSTMMLSSNAAVDSAKASMIISNLRTLKLAALAWYGDNLDVAVNSLENNKNDIIKYISSETGSLESYKFEGSNEGTWYVSYEGADLTTSVKEKLAGRSKSAGLLKAASKEKGEGENATAHFGAGDSKVYMFIR